MRKSIYIFATILLIGCGIFEKEITGNIFIVTKGGTNIKLGLIPVSITPKDKFEIKRESAINLLDDFYNKNIQEFTELKIKYINEQKIFTPLETKLNEKNNKFEEFIKTNDGRDSVHIWDHENSVYVGFGGNRNTGVEIQNNLNGMAEEINIIYNEILPVYNKMYNIREQMLSIVIKSRQLEKIRVRNFIKSLEDGSIKTKSNADGEFKSKIGRFKDYVISAYGKRSNGGEDETYDWMLEFNSNSKNQDNTILISNDSLIENIPGDENSIKKLYELRFYENLKHPRNRGKFILK
jgi:hypothetical protein